MGTGEPMMLLRELIGAIRMAKVRDVKLASLNVATVGIPERILEYAECDISGVKLNLQLSLHGTTDNQRLQIMPRAALFGIKEVLSAASYFSKTKTRVVVNYLLLHGINDSSCDAERLAKLLDPELFVLKISELNSIPEGTLVPSSRQRLFEFQDWLLERGLPVRIFTSAGVDIGAGCGQFSNSPI